MFRGNQPSFGAGVLSPASRARVDLAKYAVGLATAENMFIHPQGGASNRAGFEYVLQTKGDNIGRNIKFIYDADTGETYQLQFTHLKMRVIRLGAPVLESAKVITGISAANPAVVTCVAHGYANGDEVLLNGIAGPTLLNGRNVVVRNVTANTFTLEDLDNDPISSVALPAYVSGGTCRRIYEIASPYAEADLALVKFAQEKDVMFFAHSKYPPQKLSRFGDANWAFSVASFIPGIAAPAALGGTAIFVARSGSSASFQWQISAVSAANNESTGTLSPSVSLQYSVDDGQRVKLTWAASPGAAFYKVYRTTNGLLMTTTNTEVDFSQTQYTGDGTFPPGVSAGGAPAAPSSVTAVATRGEALKYKVSAISGVTSEESLPSAEYVLFNALNYKGNRNILTWTAVPLASSYVIYRFSNGRWGYIGQSETTSFVDENITPDLAQGPQEGSNPFDAVGRYPRCLTFIEQRLAYAGADGDPSAANLGQSGNYENFGSASPATARDAIAFRVRSREKNVIKAMMAMQNGLALFTSAGEWIVNGGNEGFLTPSNVKVRPQTNRGISNIDPLLIGNVILFPQARGNVVRDFSYDFANDSFAGNDLTVLARHLFKGRKLVSWDYAQSPDSLIWCIMDDGALLTLTYMREHEIWAWTTHKSDSAFFEDVSVVPEGDEDVPYFVVKRVFGNRVKRFVERLRSRNFGTDVKECFFVDSGLTYRGPAVTRVGGAWHLEGRSVVALADGNVIEGLTVQNGAVTLPNAAAVVHVGLSYTSYIETLDIDMGVLNGSGTVQGRYKTIGKITAKVENSRAVLAGQSLDRLDEWKQRQNESFGEPVRLHTGDVEITAAGQWDRAGHVFVAQMKPLPLTVLSVAPEIKVGG